MRIASLIVAVLVASPALLGAERGPSTPEERQKVVALVRHLEADPLARSAREERQWLLAWLTEVPDVTVSVCVEFFPGVAGSRYKYKTEMGLQPVYSTAAFLIEHPDQTADQQATALAGIEGTLRAYEAIVRSDPKARFAELDELLSKRDKGELVAFVQATLPKCSRK